MLYTYIFFFQWQEKSPIKPFTDQSKPLIFINVQTKKKKKRNVSSTTTSFGRNEGVQASEKQKKTRKLWIGESISYLSLVIMLSTTPTFGAPRPNSFILFRWMKAPWIRIFGWRAKKKYIIRYPNITWMRECVLLSFYSALISKIYLTLQWKPMYSLPNGDSAAGGWHTHTHMHHAAKSRPRFYLT